jgi:hypothetical protein
MRPERPLRDTLRSMKLLILMTVVCLSACGWLGLRRPPASPGPTEIIITGAPLNSLVFVDGRQVGASVRRNDASEIIKVAPGAHRVEIHVNDAVVYREDTYAGSGEHRVVTVLSGSSR